MSETGDDDIFGKMDALLGKRAGFAGAARLRDDIDFPLLTEVVAAPGVDQSAPEPAPLLRAEARLVSPEPVVRPEPIIFPAPVDIPPAAADPWPLPPGPEADRLLWGDEPVASDEADAIEVPAAAEAAPIEAPPAPQDTELEALLRRIIREELERILGRG